MVVFTRSSSKKTSWGKGKVMHLRELLARYKPGDFQHRKESDVGGRLWPAVNGRCRVGMTSISWPETKMFRGVGERPVLRSPCSCQGGCSEHCCTTDATSVQATIRPLVRRTAKGRPRHIFPQPAIPAMARWTSSEGQGHPKTP